MNYEVAWFHRSVFYICVLNWDELPSFPKSPCNLGIPLYQEKDVEMQYFTILFDQMLMKEIAWSVLENILWRYERRFTFLMIWLMTSQQEVNVQACLLTWIFAVAVSCRLAEQHFNSLPMFVLW